jgi:uncharacterized membrane protein YdjX (TVP38/TMEM64 family)
VLLAVLAGIIAASKAGLFQLHDVTRLRAVVEHVRATPALPLIFVAAYVVMSAVGVPASALTLAGGALFGATRGIALNWLGAFGGALLAFGVVRAMSLHALTQRLHAESTAGKLLGPGAPMLLFRLRLVPVAPFALLNVGAGMSRMSWRSYALATGLGIVPVTVIYTVFSASLIAGVQGSGTRAMVVALVSAAAIIGLTVWINAESR